MNALIDFEPEAEIGLADLVRRYPNLGLQKAQVLMAWFVNAVRLRLRGVQVPNIDQASEAAIDDFIEDPKGVVTVRDDEIYFVAERGLPLTAISVVKVGLAAAQH